MRPHTAGCLLDQKGEQCIAPCCSQVYCINLKRRPDRKKKTEEQFKRMGIEVARVVQWWPAVDGEQLRERSMLQPDISVKMYNECSLGEIGCALSHMGIWKDMLQRGLATAMIFEDDIEGQPGFYQQLDQYWHQLPTDWDILYLGVWDTGRSRRYSSNLSIPGYPLYLHAYCLSNRGARRLLELIPPCRVPIDNAVADHASQLKVVNFHPQLVRQDESWAGSDLLLGRLRRRISPALVVGVVVIVVVVLLIYRAGRA